MKTAIARLQTLRMPRAIERKEATMLNIRPWHVLVALNVLTLGALAWTSAQSQGQPPVQDLVRARVIEIVNEQGEMRAQLYVGENGGGAMRIRSGNGEIRVKFGATDDGGAALLLMDRTTTPTIQLQSAAQGPYVKLTGTVGERLLTP